ncbi:HTH-type transcriptional regulator AbgR [Cedecea neteri]|uniref:HTH-type transcriptional regulator AbgR n=1 Tax=Cedecea neteri TaxID=158822 RepID=A0A291DTT1_9ENTR|nr:transcriptional regulator TdcA [Cedecea neteri]ATF91112.1 transcriptional regulator TdcA [Cedecea neteri]SQA99552.1 HTH-type transcriptional regulator AbgR [Cedecea neteri]
MDNTTLPKTQHLVVFQEVVRSGSFGSAAKQLGLTQPAVSKIISDMEALFGLELIIRKNTGVQLTVAGKVLLGYAESITREMRNMCNEMNSLVGSEAVDVSFGYPSLIGFTFLPGMMKAFKELYPHAEVSMFEAQLCSFLPAIRDGRLDFAIGTLSDEMLLQDLHIEPLFESDFILVASRTRTRGGAMTLRSLSHEQWVLPHTEMGYYSELLTILQKNHITSDKIIKTDSVVTIYNMVLTAGFLTIIPREMIAPFGSQEFIQVPLTDELPVARYAAVWSKNCRIKKSAATLVELARVHSVRNKYQFNKLTVVA